MGLHGKEEHCPFLGLVEATELTSPDCSLLAEAQYDLLLAMCSVGETMLHSRNLEHLCMVSSFEDIFAQEQHPGLDSEDHPQQGPREDAGQPICLVPPKSCQV